MIEHAPDRAGFSNSGATFVAVLLAAASATALAAAPAAAQQALILDGPPISGELETSDPQSDDRHYDSYRVRLREGESVQIDMASEALDSVLEILPPGGTDEPLKSHDDIGGGSRDARLRFTAPAAGDYFVRALGFQGGTGAYTLSAKRRILAAPPAVVALQSGADVSGRFNERSAVDEEDRPYALYEFDGRKGERVRIDMVSTTLDSKLDLSHGAFSVSNDDGGEGLNSRIFAILPETGRYRLKARSINEQSGTYALALQVHPPAGPPAPPRTLRREAPNIGRLSFDDPNMELALDDKGEPTYFYRLYALPMRAGETVTIDLKAESFDPVLDAGVMSPLGFAVARSNDDTDGTNARLVLSPTGDGTVYIRARSLNAESMGDYILTVTDGAPPPAGAEAEAEDPHEH
jgi:hypothetical protein